MRIRSLALCLLAALPGTAWAGPRDFVVFLPGMGGTQQSAKPFVEQFLREMEKSVGWPAKAADGEYFEQLEEAQRFIKERSPGYGLVTPGVYLDLVCRKEGVELLARAVLQSGDNSGNYHVVVKDAALKDLKQLKGKRLASNHLQNARFVSNVIFAGALGDAAQYFTLLPTPSPLKPLKQLDRGEADAVLLDDAQLANMKKLPFGASLKVIYSSEPVPAYPVVAFTRETKAPDRDKMKAVLLDLCAKQASVCKLLQITRFEAMPARTYDKAEALYCKP